MLFGTAVPQPPNAILSSAADWAYMYILHVLQCTYNYYKIRQGSQRAVCMWDKYNMDIVQNTFVFYSIYLIHLLSLSFNKHTYIEKEICSLQVKSNAKKLMKNKAYNASKQKNSLKVS